MTRTDSMVSSGPQTAGAATLGSELHDDRRSARSRRVARRALLAVPLALAVAIPAPALAQTETTTNATSGYGTKPPVTTKTEPKSGTAPSKEATTPKSAPEPTSTTPATSTEPAKSSTAPAAESKLPFTGLDLRWVVGAGLLLLAAGLSIRLTQRRSAGR
jgi:outer membrane biosynthesis protein TonB